MRRVLFLAYYFPPIGGAGVQRNAKLARYLPAFGYELVVVTGPGAAADRWRPFDGTMTAKIPAGTVVHRLPGPEPAPSNGWRDRAERWFRLEAQWPRWWYVNAVRLGREVGADADVIHASLAPYETAGAARTLARDLGKPLVVDLEDPWALDEMMIYPSAVHRELELAEMRKTLVSAEAVVMNTPESAKRVLNRFPELRSKLVISIPNGIDSADFGGPPQECDGRTFRIVHTGSLHTDLGRRHRRLGLARRLLGGAVSEIEVLTRSHVYLLQAINALIEGRPELASKIEVHFAGILTEADLEVCRRSPVVRVHGFLPHDKTLQLMRSADLLFLPMHDLPEGGRAGIVPCKTYEYLASGRPILAAVPNGDVRDLLSEAGNAFLCRPSDVHGLRRIIAEQLERFWSGRPAPMPDPAVLARFEPRKLVQQLAHVFDAVCRSRTAVHARLPVRETG